MTVSVTLNADPTPVAQVEAAAVIAPAPRFGGVTIIDERQATVRDSTGRLIKVRKLSALDRVRLFRAMGSVDAENRMLSSYASTAAAVTELDSHAIPFPSTSLQLDAIIGRLDEHGLEAVILALIALSPKQEETTQAVVKNS
jgi:hypothetical protein